MRAYESGPATISGESGPRRLAGGRWDQMLWEVVPTRREEGLQLSGNLLLGQCTELYLILLVHKPGL